MKNLHIVLNAFRHESRVLKETHSLVQCGLVEQVFIAALFESGLQEYENIDASRTVWRVKLRSRDWSKNFFAQLLKYIEFCWRVSSYANKNHIKIVNVHCLGLLPLGVWLRLKLGVKLIYDAHELETETLHMRGFKKKFFKVLERLLVRFVDLTIVVGGEIEKWYRNEYPIYPIVTLLNCPFYQHIQKTSLLREEFNIPAHRKIILYQGGLSVGRGIELLLDAFEQACEDRYTIVFMGYGELEARIKNAAARYPHICYKPPVSHAHVFLYTASADIGVSITEDSCLNHRYCLPNKLFEYAMARVPILVSNLPEMSKIVKSRGIGVVMEDWNTYSFWQALQQLEAMQSDELNQCLSDTAKEFSWQAQEEIMVRAYQTYIVAKSLTPDVTQSIANFR